MSEDFSTEPRGTNQLARRDFSGTEMMARNGATDVLAAKAKAMTEAKWIMAMRRPRDLDVVRQLIVRECQRPGFADAAVYSVPRGESRIEGLSIRFAEAAVRCMGNLEPEVTTTFEDDQVRLVRATVTDYESNVTWSKDITVRKTVERKFPKKGQQALGERLNSYGERVYIVEATDDDVNTKEAALVSKALRTLILRCVPGHIQDEALRICNAVCADKTAKDPDAERIRILDAFAAIGVPANEVADFLGHPTTRMAPVELDKLRKAWAAVEGGEVSWGELLTTAMANRAAEPVVSSTATPTTSAPAAAQATNAAPAQQPATTTAAPAQSKASTSKPKGTDKLKATLTADQPVGGNPTSKLDAAAAQARAKDAEREERKAAEAQQPDPALTTKTAAGPDPMTEPAWMSGRYEKGAKIGPSQLPPEQEPPTEGNEYRGCNDCGVLIEVPATEGLGSLCYTCRQA